MKRNTKIDFLRIISMLLVIVIHVCNCYCRSFNIISKTSYYFSSAINILSRISVPIFFMISGALLATKEQTKEKYKTRIIKNIIILAAWTIIYLLWEYFYLGIKYKDFYNVLLAPKRAHLWFMYAIIGIYIAQPFISKMLNNLNKDEKKLFIILWLIVCGLKIGFKYQIPIIGTTYYLGYFVIGSIIYNEINNNEEKYKKYNIYLILSFIIPMIISIITTYIISSKYNINYKGLMEYSKLLIMIPSISIYILVLINYKSNSKIILELSKYSLGIYLVHGIYLDIIKNIFNIYNVSSIIGIPIFTMIIFILSLLTVYILKKIPIIKEYLC